MIPSRRRDFGEALEIVAAIHVRLGERVRAERLSRPRRRRGGLGAAAALERGRRIEWVARGHRRGRASMAGIALDVAATHFFDPASGTYALASEGRRRSTPARWSTCSPAGSSDYPIVSIEDGLAEDDWAAGPTLTRDARPDPAHRRRPVRHPVRAAPPGDRGRRRQRHPDQAEPGRHALARRSTSRAGPPARLPHDRLGPLGRDRGRHHRRPRRRHRRRPDQDRLGRPLRAPRQVQPAPADRGGARSTARIRRRRSARAGPQAPGDPPMRLASIHRRRGGSRPPSSAGSASSRCRRGTAGPARSPRS